MFGRLLFHHSDSDLQCKFCYQAITLKTPGATRVFVNDYNETLPTPRICGTGVHKDLATRLQISIH